MVEPQDFRWRRADEQPSRLYEAAGWSEGIRALYDAVAQEPLPADFVKLLDELRKKSAQ